MLAWHHMKYGLATDGTIRENPHAETLLESNTLRASHTQTLVDHDTFQASYAQNFVKNNEVPAEPWGAAAAVPPHPPGGEAKREPWRLPCRNTYKIQHL